jgi:hypothetical protein
MILPWVALDRLLVAVAKYATIYADTAARRGLRCLHSLAFVPSLALILPCEERKLGNALTEGEVLAIRDNVYCYGDL